MKNVSVAQALACLKIVNNEDNFRKNILEKLASKDRDERQAAIATINEGLSVFAKYLRGEELPEEVVKFIDQVQKVSGPLHVLPNALWTPGVDIVGDSTLDLGWMSAFRVEDARNVEEIYIEDFTNMMSVARYAKAEKTKISAINREKLTALRENGRVSVGVAFDTQFFTKYPRYTFNKLMADLRKVMEDYKAKTAYAAIAGMTGTTETYATSTLNTTNNAAATLIGSLRTGGYGVTANSPLVLFANPKHKAKIMSDLTAVLGTASNNQVIQWNITPVFSFEIPVQPESSKDGAILCLPGVKNVWGTFSDMYMAEDSSAETDSVNLFVNERWNYNLNSAQFIVVRFQA